MKHRVALIAGLACLLLAGFIAVLADDVRRWPDAMRAGDVELRLRPARRDPWLAPDRLPMHPAARLLSVDDDLEYRRALRFYILTRRRFRRIPGFATPIDGARRRLRFVVRNDTDPERRSAAANFLGVITNDTSSFIDERYVVRALRYFRDAIRLDPTNTQAKFNLELLLERDQTLDQGATGGFGRSRATLDVGGAGIASSGRGY